MNIYPFHSLLNLFVPSLHMICYDASTYDVVMLNVDFLLLKYLNTRRSGSLGRLEVLHVCWSGIL